jgi:pyruvate-ferredoxin/flavodoxin oxidoreductase
MKSAVGSGYWPLYRYHPSPDPGAHPFQLDSKRSGQPLREFALSETRYSSLARVEPERARHLLALAQADIDERWDYYQQMAGERRSVPQDGGDEALPASGDEPDEEPT